VGRELQLRHQECRNRRLQGLKPVVTPEIVGPKGPTHKSGFASCCARQSATPTVGLRPALRFTSGHRSCEGFDLRCEFLNTPWRRIRFLPCGRSPTREWLRSLGKSCGSARGETHRREHQCLESKRGTKRRARRKKYLRRAKGFFLTKSKLYQSAQEAVNRAERFSFRDRRVRKRQFRTLWIQRIGAAARNAGMSYSQLMHGLKAPVSRSTAKVLGPSRREGRGRIYATRRARQGRRGKNQGVSGHFPCQSHFLSGGVLWRRRPGGVFVHQNRRKMPATLGASIRHETEPNFGGACT